MTPFSLRLTLSTMAACASMDMFLWMMPNPPSRAIAIAMRASVTVSMAALSIGMFNFRFFASWTLKSTSLGSTLLCCGTSKTSSKVRPSRMVANLNTLSFAVFCRL